MTNSEWKKFMMEFEHKMEQEMHEEWINNKKKAELKKSLDDLSEKMKKEQEIENR